MSGMEPMLIGAALGGGTSALMGKNPIQGALLGGLSGGVYGMANAASPIASAGMGVGGKALPSVMGAAPTNIPAVAGMPLGSGFTGTMPNIVTSPLSTGAMSTPFNVASATAPSFAQTLQNIPSALNQGIRENPMYAMQGMNAAQGLLQPEPMPQAPMGQVQRGQPMAPVNFASLLNPQQYKPQPISLLG